MEKEKMMEQATCFKALGDLNRLKILTLLTQGEVCACKILETFDLSRSTLSHHMKILTRCVLVRGRNEGKWTHYSLNPDIGKSMIKFLEGLHHDNFTMVE